MLVWLDFLFFKIFFLLHYFLQKKNQLKDGKFVSGSLAEKDVRVVFCFSKLRILIQNSREKSAAKIYPVVRARAHTHTHTHIITHPPTHRDTNRH